MTASRQKALDIKTPLSQFIIDEETSAFDNAAAPPPPPPSETKFRQRPRHGSQTDFTQFLNQKAQEEKESHFDSQICFILNSFAKQYLREYIKMKIKSTVYDTIDKELNRKSFTSIPQYYHLRKKEPPKSPTHPLTDNNISTEIRHSEGFQPVYSLRIASSRTEIGGDKNEYTAYIIVGSRISPFDSKLTVCVKRFTELRTFASEIERRLINNGKQFQLNHEFPFHTRLFGNIDKKKLEERRNTINKFLEDVCADENAVRHSYFLTFFDFNDGQYNYIDDDEKYEQINKYQEEEFRLKCIEETLEIIGMNGGIPLEEDEDISSDDDSSDDQQTQQNDPNNPNQTPLPNESDENYFISDLIHHIENIDDAELNFEVPYDLHHYKNPEYKLVAAIFDIIQQQLELEESYMNEQNDDHSLGRPSLHHHHNQRSNNFMDSYRNSMHGNQDKFDIDDIYHNGTPNFGQHRTSSAMSKPKHARKHSGGHIAPAPIKHLRATSIIESSYSPATPMEFHPSISSNTGQVQNNINTSNYVAGWTASQFKNKFHSSIRGIDGGPRIIRTASEATSDRSLSYKIPTMVNEVWGKITRLLDMKEKSIPNLLNAVKKDLYPVIQEAMNDVAPIIKLLYNNSPNATAFGPETSAEESGHDTDDHKMNGGKVRNPLKVEPDDGSNKSLNVQNNQTHGKYLSIFGHGYDGDEDIDTDSSDSDGSEIRRSVGVRHFPFVKAMRQYCLTEPRLYEFFLAFENLAIDQVFGDINIIFSDMNTGNKKKNKDQRVSVKQQQPSQTEKLKNGRQHRKYQSSVDFGDYIPSISGLHGNKLPHYEYIDLLRYNYSVLENTSSRDFTDRIRHIERIHNQINLVLCEIIYATLKCMMKCLGDIILYKDALEEKYSSCGNTFDQDVVNSHEDSLLSILRDSGYNISFIVDDLKQKIKSEFKDYSSIIFNPLLDGISTIGELSLNCICLMISQFVFDEGEFPNTIQQFRESFISIWFEPIDYYIADFTECVFYILYQSSIGLVHSASQDLLQQNIFSYASAAASHSSSLWYQILRGQKIKNIKKFIPKLLSKNVSLKDILDLVIERTLTNIVDETLIYIKLECEKSFFKKFEKKEQRLFNHDF